MPPTITYTPTIRPPVETGKTSPYPTVADVTTKYHQYVPGAAISLSAGSTSAIASQLVRKTKAATASGSRQPRSRTRRNRDRR